MDYVIHPLVFLNISDHYTRAKVNHHLTPTTTLCGCLMGTMVPPRAEVFTSFEVKVEGDAADLELLIKRRDQIKECYQDYILLGVYFLGQSVTETAMKLYKQIAANEDRELILLMFDEKQTREEKQFTLYTLDDEKLIKTPYTTESLEPERIAVDAIAHNYSDTNKKVNEIFTDHITSLRTVLTTLREHLAVIREFLVKQKAIAAQPGAPCNYDILRNIGGMIKSVPQTFDFSKAIMEEPPTDSEPPPSSTSSFSTDPSAHVTEYSAPILKHLSNSKLSQAYLSEYTEAAIIIALTRMYPLLTEFQKKDRVFSDLERKYERIRHHLQEMKTRSEREPGAHPYIRRGPDMDGGMGLEMGMFARDPMRAYAFYSSMGGFLGGRHPRRR